MENVRNVNFVDEIKDVIIKESKHFEDNEIDHVKEDQQ